MSTNYALPVVLPLPGRKPYGFSSLRKAYPRFWPKEQRQGKHITLLRRLETKPSPKLGNPVLAQEIIRLSKEDLSPEQISGWLVILYPEQPEMRASAFAIYTCLCGETAKDPALKEHFRQKQAKPRR
ncbi:MAG: hypothetical protein LBK61_13695 [Spirochaetaceae bacterium]|nr:hypothetical protein [Spirochaetaceae bacterium]